jgi:hypothetical protein
VGPILSDKKRQHVINRVMDRLRDWRFSPFEHEAPMVQGLRSAFCEKGEPWSRADREAAELVAQAESLLGLKRPTWEQGQREWTDSPDHCSWCQGPMEQPEAERFERVRRFCSADCARQAVAHRTWRPENYRGAVYREAIRIISKDRAPTKNCPQCGNTFRSDRPEQVYCTLECKIASQRVLPDIQCAECERTFRPRTSRQKCCSKVCDGRLKARLERERLADETRLCQHCGEPFTPATEHQIYCSDRCSHDVASKAWHRRNYAPAEHHLTCHWCGGAYVSKMPWSTTCSKACRQKVNSLTSRKEPKSLAWQLKRTLKPEVVDYVLRASGARITCEAA